MARSGHVQSNYSSLNDPCPARSRFRVFECYDNYRKNFLSRTITIPAIIARMPTSTPDGDGCEGVPVDAGTVVNTIVPGKVLVTGLGVAIVAG